MAGKLETELVPEALWGKSLREQYPTQWGKLKGMARAWAGSKCEICGGTGTKYPVEIHEVWEYTVTDMNGLQRLLRLIALCPACHAAKHYGRSAIVRFPDGLRKLRQHMMSVNGCSEKELNLSLAEARRIWDERNRLEWSQDLSSFFTEYKCRECSRTRDLRPVVTREERVGITEVEWLCKRHQAVYSEECTCHNLSISIRYDVQDLHNLDSDNPEYGPVGDGTEHQDNIWWQGDRR